MRLVFIRVKWDSDGRIDSLMGTEQDLTMAATARNAAMTLKAHPS